MTEPFSILRCGARGRQHAATYRSCWEKGASREYEISHGGALQCSASRVREVDREVFG